MRYIIDIGGYTLDVTVNTDADLDGRFAAICNETGDLLYINGWLIDSIDHV